MVTDKELLVFCDLLNLDVEYMDVNVLDINEEATGEYHTASTLIDTEFKMLEIIDSGLKEKVNKQMEAYKISQKHANASGQGNAIPTFVQQFSGTSSIFLKNKFEGLDEDALDGQQKRILDYISTHNTFDNFKSGTETTMRSSAKLFMDYYDGKKERDNCFLNKWTVKDTGNEYLLCKKLYMSIIDKDINILKNTPSNNSEKRTKIHGLEGLKKKFPSIDSIATIQAISLSFEIIDITGVGSSMIPVKSDAVKEMINFGVDQLGYTVSDTGLLNRVFEYSKDWQTNKLSANVTVGQSGVVEYAFNLKRENRLKLMIMNKGGEEDYIFLHLSEELDLGEARIPEVNLISNYLIDFYDGKLPPLVFVGAGEGGKLASVLEIMFKNDSNAFDSIGYFTKIPRDISALKVITHSDIKSSGEYKDLFTVGYDVAKSGLSLGVGGVIILVTIALSPATFTLGTIIVGASLFFNFFKDITKFVLSETERGEFLKLLDQELYKTNNGQLTSDSNSRAQTQGDTSKSFKIRNSNNEIDYEIAKKKFTYSFETRNSNIIIEGISINAYVQLLTISLVFDNIYDIKKIDNNSFKISLHEPVKTEYDDDNQSTNYDTSSTFYTYYEVLFHPDIGVIYITNSTSNTLTTSDKEKLSFATFIGEAVIFAAEFGERFDKRNGESNHQGYALTGTGSTPKAFNKIGSYVSISKDSPNLKNYEKNIGGEQIKCSADVAIERMSRYFNDENNISVNGEYSIDYVNVELSNMYPIRRG